MADSNVHVAPRHHWMVTESCIDSLAVRVFAIARFIGRQLMNNVHSKTSLERSLIV